ncbi:hypothetical protein GC163_20285 [bacterium]|nr:hypothetical protein [bacterium]
MTSGLRQGLPYMTAITERLPASTAAFRVAGVTFGVVTQSLFAVTVVFLYQFLREPQGTDSRWAVAIDLGLVLQFAVSHSVLLLPSVKSRLSRWIQREFYGSFFCVVTCVSLGLTFWQWRSFGPTLWSASGAVANLIQLGFLGSWVALFYSLWLTGLGYQTGLTEWWYWLRRRPLPRRGFQERGAYRWLRHPVYLSFLGLLWFTPHMTADHALLTGVWTIYIFIGSVLKDQRLVYFLGESYRAYARRVPGYPFFFLGPLAKWSQPVSPDTSPYLRQAA